MAASGSKKAGKETNMGVDYVICFRFASTGECVLVFWKRSSVTAIQTKLRLRKTSTG